MFLYDLEESPLTPPTDKTGVEYQTWIAVAVIERARLRRENAELRKLRDRLYAIAFVLFLAFSLSLGYAFRNLVEPGIEAYE